MDRDDSADGSSVEEHRFYCSQCHYEEWREEDPQLGGNECPNCDCGMTAIAGRANRSEEERKEVFSLNGE